MLFNNQMEIWQENKQKKATSSFDWCDFVSHLSVCLSVFVSIALRVSEEKKKENGEETRRTNNNDCTKIKSLYIHVYMYVRKERKRKRKRKKYCLQQ